MGGQEAVLRESVPEITLANGLKGLASGRQAGGRCPRWREEMTSRGAGAQNALLREAAR